MLQIKIETIPDGKRVAEATIISMTDLDSIPRGYGVIVSVVGPPAWERRGFIDGRDLEVWALAAKVTAWAAAEAEKR
jgi:hypothetical protein